MKITVKNMPRLKLVDLLKRRKMSLKQFISEFGITTYEGLVKHCDRMGVCAPEVFEFHTLVPQLSHVNNPQEGVVVVEIQSQAQDNDEPHVEEHKDTQEVETVPTAEPQKKQRKKKEVASVEEK